MTKKKPSKRPFVRRRIALNAQKVNEILNNPDAKVYHYSDHKESQEFIAAIKAMLPQSYSVGMEIYSGDNSFKLVLGRMNRMRASTLLPSGHEHKEVFVGTVYTLGEVRWLLQRCFETVLK